MEMPPSQPSCGTQRAAAKMPRYTYYLSNYQCIGASANYAFSNDGDKTQAFSPKFGNDVAGEEKDMLVQDVGHGSSVFSTGASDETAITGGSSVHHMKGNESSCPSLVKEHSGGTIMDDAGRAKHGCMDPDDELCSASVAEDFTVSYTDSITNAEDIREPGSSIVIDQPFAANLKRWGSTYAYGNMEEFRKKQKEKMEEITDSLFSKGPLDEFPIRCIFAKGETGSDGKFDPLYIKVGDVIANRYHVAEILGSTPFSIVLKVRDEKGGDYECMKISMPDTVSQAIDEINLLKILNNTKPDESKTIVRLKDYFYFRGCIFSILELLGLNLYEATRELYKKSKLQVTPMDLNEAVSPTPREETKGWDLSDIRQIAIDVLTSLKYMHSMGIINCDLKPENIVLNNGIKAPIVKLIDFGSSCYIQEQLSNYVQSRPYRAPEVILGLPYDTQVDLWSLGCVLCEIFMQRILFPSDNNATLMASMISLLGVPPVYILQHKMNSTFMVLPNGKVADLTIMTDTLKGSQKNLTSDYQSSIRCNMSLSDSSCSSLFTTQKGNKIDANNSEEFDSVIDLNDAQGVQPDAVPTEFTNITPRKYSIMGSAAVNHADDVNRFHQANKGIKLDIGHGPSKSKCVRIIEPTRCSIDEMLGSSSSPELAVFADFIKGLLQYDPLERLTATTALNHRFITRK